MSSSAVSSTCCGTNDRSTSSRWIVSSSHVIVVSAPSNSSATTTATADGRLSRSRSSSSGGGGLVAITTIGMSASWSGSCPRPTNALGHSFSLERVVGGVDPCGQILGEVVPGLLVREVGKPGSFGFDQVADGDDPVAVGQWGQRQLGEDRPGKASSGLDVSGEGHDAVHLEVEVQVRAFIGLADGDEQGRRARWTVEVHVDVDGVIERPDNAVPFGQPPWRRVGGRLVEQYLEAVCGVPYESGSASGSRLGEGDCQFSEGVLELLDELLVGHGHHRLVKVAILRVRRG